MLDNKQKKLNIFILWIATMVAVLSWPVVATAQIPRDPNLFEEPHMPGTVEGTGTYFEVTDSNYLNITFESSEPVHLVLESVPETVVMDIEAAEGATSTQITLGGFESSTTYYKYEDNYHNLVTFTTDPNGSYSYTQDLAEPHLVFIQPSPSTIFLSDSGWSDPAVGTWDPVTKTATLTRNVSESIQIDSDGIILDGNGFSVIGSGTSFGVFLDQRSNVTITNLTVEGFIYGIYLYYNCSSNTLTGNIANSNNYTGIYLNHSSGNTLTDNTASNNGRGIIISNQSSNNTLTGNIANSNNYYGICLDYFSNNNTLTGNTTNSNNFHGIYLTYNSSSNTLTGNTANSNNYAGIQLFINSSNNTLTGNTTSGNGYGISLDSSNNTLTYNTVALNNSFGMFVLASNNLIYNNNFIDNYRQASAFADNVFNLSEAEGGGNYWSNWCPPEHPDSDGDGFVDEPYVFYGGPDNLPWAIPNGWVNQAPVAMCQDVTVMADSYCEGVVWPEDVNNGSWDPDGDPITLSLSPEGPYPMGTNDVNLIVTDDQGASSTCTARVKVLTAGEGIIQLITKVLALNLQAGIENSLDAKLDAALQALDDLNTNNDVAAINAIEAFINAVEAQSGNKIQPEDADDLIETAINIIVALQNGCH